MLDILNEGLVTTFKKSIMKKQYLTFNGQLAVEKVK